MMWGYVMRGEGRNFFSRDKKFLSSPAPPSLFKKSEILFILSAVSIGINKLFHIFDKS